MRVLITGGRKFSDKILLNKVLNKLHQEFHFTLLIHGDASGADSLAKKWALDKGIDILSCPADWKTYGKSAGPIRNKSMLKHNPELVVAFPGSNGTLNMITLAKNANINIVYATEVLV